MILTFWSDNNVYTYETVFKFEKYKAHSSKFIIMYNHKQNSLIKMCS